MHLLGNVDKGAALRIIRAGFRRKFPNRNFRAVAIGDSPNDFEMLKAADIRILVKKPDGTHDTGGNIPGLINSPGIGPAGWNESVLRVIDG